MRPNTEMLSALKRQFEYSLTDFFDDDFSTLPSTAKKGKIDEIKTHPAPISRLIATEEFLDEETPVTNTISLSKPKVPSPTKLKSPKNSGVPCLENNEEIIAWIVKNKQFLTTSFSGELDNWVKIKIKAEPTFIRYKKILEQFVEEFHNAMQDSILDVRKLYPDTHLERDDCFPDAYACFIDGVNGITDERERNSDVLSNSGNNVLRVFLEKNRIVAECLAYGLPTLNEVAELWTRENSTNLSPITTSVSSPLKSVSSPHKSPIGKSPSKTVIHKTENAVSSAVDTKVTHLLANSMNGLFTHVNSNGALRKPISPPGSPIKVKRPPAPAPVEPGMNRKERVYRQLTYPKNG